MKRQLRTPGVVAIDHRFSAEQRLFLHVLSIALNDAIGNVGASRAEERERIQQEAIRWYTDAGKDFQTVCLAAGLEPEAVRKGALAYINATRAAAEKAPPKPHGGGAGPKLTGAQRALIARERWCGMSCRTLASIFSVSPSTISSINPEDYGYGVPLMMQAA